MLYNSMFVSEELRKSNIAEYLLYMWQVEDTVRAAGLDPDRLYDAVISGSGRSDRECQAWKQWYADIADMMRREGKVEKGHLQVNAGVLDLLSDLHARLVGSGRMEEYRDAYYKALPFIVELRAKKHCPENNELQDCFEFMYGVWMLNLQKKTISSATAQAVDAISKMIAMLASYYRDDKEGRLDLD